jgi:hypothetical protein
MKSFRVQPADAIGGALGDAVGDATGAIADATGAISTAMHAWTPATFSPPALGLRAERAVDYVGEKASMFSFFTNFYTIILRKRGSALPKIMIEIILATGLGVVAYLLTEDGICGKHGAEKCKGFFLPPSTSREKGHAMIGVLLAFLVVFRSQIAWGMYMEGRNAVGRVVAMSRCLALELLASLAHACVEEGISEQSNLGVSRSGRPRVVVRRGGVTLPTIRRTKKSDIELAVLTLECVRLLKLRRPAWKSTFRRPTPSTRPARWRGASTPSTRPKLTGCFPQALLDADRARALGRRRGGVDGRGGDGQSLRHYTGGRRAPRRVRRRAAGLTTQ